MATEATPEMPETTLETPDTAASANGDGETAPAEPAPAEKAATGRTRGRTGGRSNGRDGRAAVKSGAAARAATAPATNGATASPQPSVLTPRSSPKAGGVQMLP